VCKTVHHAVIGLCVLGMLREMENNFLNHTVKISVVEVNINAQCACKVL